MNTFEIGKKLVELCRAGKSMEAINTLYSPDIVSQEVADMGATKARTEGIAGVKKKNEWWYANHEIHSGEVDGPWPHGDQFIVRFKYDVTAKAGPMAGQRMTMDEAALYTVQEGKIVKEAFFYHMG